MLFRSVCVCVCVCLSVCVCVCVCEGRPRVYEVCPRVDGTSLCVDGARPRVYGARPCVYEPYVTVWAWAPASGDFDVDFDFDPPRVGLLEPANRHSGRPLSKNIKHIERIDLTLLQGYGSFYHIGTSWGVLRAF